MALDYIIECEPGCYSLIGDGIDDQGNVKNAKRADWSPGSAFVTPPGLWHSHHNESGKPAHLMPIQDAGLHTYLQHWISISFTRITNPISRRNDFRHHLPA